MPYMRVPFVDGGRDMAGCDCWGLVRLVYARELGIELPLYGDIPASAVARIARQMKRDAELAAWRKVERPQAFDVVLMSGRPVAGVHPRALVHVGVMIDAERVLHIEEGADAAAPLLRHPTVRQRIVAVMRHESR
jgi:cell wall-associated NlpC family hydrolase